MIFLKELKKITSRKRKFQDNERANDENHQYRVWHDGNRKRN